MTVSERILVRRASEVVTSSNTSSNVRSVFWDEIELVTVERERELELIDEVTDVVVLELELELELDDLGGGDGGDGGMKGIDSEPIDP